MSAGSAAHVSVLATRADEYECASQIKQQLMAEQILVYCTTGSVIDAAKSDECV